MGNWGQPSRLGFATIDFETTGLFPEHHDRAIEVAVVHSDPSGTITGRWETLINPGRDLGRQDIHGVSAREILAAPTFADIADELVELLSGRVVVAHNAAFDMRFLSAELSRIDYWPGAEFADLCTMRLARTYLCGGASLADCCAAFDIALVGAHRAAVDAHATAELLAAFIASSASSDWDPYFARVSALAPVGRARQLWMPRDNVEAYTASFLARIIDRVPDVATTDEQAEYLDLVERCILDRYLSEHEKSALVALADRVGLSHSTARRLHHDFFVALARVAWSDGLLTDEEQADLALVATLLEVDAAALETALAAPMASADAPPARSSFALEPGSAIVLTGDMRRVRSEWESVLAGLGYVPKPAVTKAVSLVVAADPDSLSGKAKKARDYGIPIVGEAWLEDFVRA
ncbi:DNA polymerase III subunit epsilon [Microbacterium marinum]|uniref:exonuclease domain-containing protein n=1 Tax=Microbacterium marinum TaxID=421115 RepID=UPI00384CCBA9